MELAVEGGIEIPEQVLAAGFLSDYAVEVRYPGITEPVTQEEYLEAVNLARTVIEWVENQVKDH